MHFAWQCVLLISMFAFSNFWITAACLSNMVFPWCNSLPPQVFHLTYGFLLHVLTVMKFCWNRAFLGSVSNYWSHNAKCLVLVVRKPEWDIHIHLLRMPCDSLFWERKKNVYVIINFKYVPMNHLFSCVFFWDWIFKWHVSCFTLWGE